MRILTVTELASFTSHELLSIYFHLGQPLVGTRTGSLERLAVEQTRANIRLVLAQRHRTPR